MNKADLSHIELQKNYELSLLQVSELTHTIEQLKEQIDWFKKQLFGRKSERFTQDDRQLYFPGFEDMVPKKISKEEKITVPAHEKKKPKSSKINSISYPDDLPVETKILDLSEEEKIDQATGQALVCIGEDVSRKLAKKPASYFIKEVIRKKYALPGYPDRGIKSPELPDSLKWYPLSRPK